MRNVMSDRTRAAFVAGILFVLALLPYVPGLQHAFVYDDHGQILENDFLSESASWKRVLTLQTLNDPSVINGRRPFVLLTYMLNHAVAPENPAIWRSTNLLFHAGAVVALYILLLRVGQGKRTLFALMAALLFAWHPLLIEAVQAPAFRPDVVCGFFVLLYMHACLRTGSVRAGWMIGWGAVALLLALFSKESALAAPLLPWLMWLVFPATRPSSRAMLAIGCLSVACIALWGWLCARPGDGNPPEWQALSGVWNGRSLLFPDNVRTMPWLAWMYARYFLLPYPLIADHVIAPVTSWFSFRFWGLLMAWGLVAYGLWRGRKNRPWLLLGGGMIAVFFAPVSNLIPLLNPFAERYAYIMGAGFAIILSDVLAGYGLGRGNWPRARLAGLASLLVLYGVLAQQRLPAWRDDFTLWSKTLQDQPASARAWTWVGLSLKANAQQVEAMEHFARARQLNPRDAAPVVNMAVLYAEAGDYTRAATLFQEAAALRPGYVPILWNLGLALQYAGRLEEAESIYDEVLALDEKHEQTRKMRMILRIERGALEAALEDVLWLEQQQPADPETRAAGAYVRERIQP